MAGRLLDEDPEAAYAARDGGRDAGRPGRGGAGGRRAGRLPDRPVRRGAGRAARGPPDLRRPEPAPRDGRLRARPRPAGEGAGHGRRPGRRRSWTPADGSRCSSSPPARAATWASPRPPCCSLQGPELKPNGAVPGRPGCSTPTPRRCSPAGRDEEALAWFGHAADADAAGETDADERLAELQGVDAAGRGRRRRTTSGAPPPTTADPLRARQHRAGPGRRLRPQDERGGVLIHRSVAHPCRRSQPRSSKRGTCGRPPSSEGSSAVASRTSATAGGRRRARQRGAPGRPARRRAGAPRAAQRRPARLVPAGGRPQPGPARDAAASGRRPSTPWTAPPGGATSSASAPAGSRATWSRCRAACGGGSGGSAPARRAAARWR